MKHRRTRRHTAAHTRAITAIRATTCPPKTEESK